MAKSSASKQTVVYIIDTSPSMSQPYPSVDIDIDSDSGSAAKASSSSPPSSFQTRLDAAKEALIGLTTDLMMQSKTNECAVIVLHTPDTNIIGQGNRRGDMDEDGYHTYYTHMTQLCPVQRPNVHLLRTIQSIKIQCNTLPPSDDNYDGDDNDNDTEIDALSGSDEHTSSNSAVCVPHRAGGFCDGIMLATSMMHKRTATKKYSRKIILFTDAEREVDIHWDQLDDTVGMLRGMDCDLTVIGLDFQRSAYFYAPAEIPSTSSSAAGDANDVNVQVGNENEDGDPRSSRTNDHDKNEHGNGNGNNYDDGDGDNGDQQNQNLLRARIKDDNEMFLISLTKYTGGQVHAAHTIQQILKQAAGKRIPRSALSKISLQIAPGLVLDARISLSTTKQSIPTLKREALVLDGDGEIKKDALGEIMSLNVTNVTSHWDADEKNVEVDTIHRSTAFPYGSSLIPIGPMEMEGLKFRSERRVTILGYVGIRDVPMTVWMGPTRIVSGGLSRKACVTISAIAQALWRKDQLAICIYVKTTDSDPCMGVLAPLVENEQGNGGYGGQEEATRATKGKGRELFKTPRHLLFVPLPFADDMTSLAMQPLTNAVADAGSARRACSEFIDAFSLPPNLLNSESIANPAIRAFRKTMIQRAINPRGDKDGGHMCTTARWRHNDINGRSNSSGTEDPMVTPQEILGRGKEQLRNFKKAFPLKVTESVVASGGRRRKKKYFMSESQEDSSNSLPIL